VDTVNTINTTPGYNEFYFETSGGVIAQWNIEGLNSAGTVGIATVKMAPYVPPSEYYEDLGCRGQFGCLVDNSFGHNQSNAGTFQ
jgi:hypothetical protein